MKHKTMALAAMTATSLFMIALVAPAGAAASAGPDYTVKLGSERPGQWDPTAPDAFCIYLGYDWGPLLRGLAESECSTYYTAWIFIWHYPPGVFQAYCLIKAQIGEDCTDTTDVGLVEAAEFRAATGSPVGGEAAFVPPPCSWQPDTLECWVLNLYSCAAGDDWRCWDNECPPGTPESSFWCSVLWDLVHRLPGASGGGSILAGPYAGFSAAP